jgi:hypothetical protein
MKEDDVQNAGRMDVLLGLERNWRLITLTEW